VMVLGSDVNVGVAADVDVDVDVDVAADVAVAVGDVGRGRGGFESEGLAGAGSFPVLLKRSGIACRIWRWKCVGGCKGAADAVEMKRIVRKMYKVRVVKRNELGSRHGGGLLNNCDSLGTNRIELMSVKQHDD